MRDPYSRYNKPMDFRATPFNNLRSQLYPRIPDLAEQAVQQKIAGDTFPKPWMPRDVRFNNIPYSISGALQAPNYSNQVLANAFALQRSRWEHAATLQKAAILKQYYVPKDEPRTIDGPVIRQIPFVERHGRPPLEVLKAQAALQNPMLDQEGPNVPRPRVEQLIAQARKQVYGYPKGRK